MSQYNKDILTGKVCPYCGEKPKKVDSSEVYGKSYGIIWLCRPCDAYVGVHKGDNKTPLGRLANAELRDLKKKAHAAFDPLWQSGKMKRGTAYNYLSVMMDTPSEFTHIGMFDVEQCKRVIWLCENKL